MPGTVFVYVRRSVSELYCVICRGRVLLSPVYFRLRIPRLVQIAVPVALQLSFRFLPLSLDFSAQSRRVRFGQLVCSVESERFIFPVRFLVCDQ